ncbi:hypothetical protein F3Y22_tig00110610pilonHSYRG00411 [Hibiscus syriacus]|uniref:Uncharacterized protein n=1 Tax=Hibiscus syriacus TaxID=106335 RepID=A0A6A3A3I8_HIBSY|nr:hypothetical protein F3Y22_tig00110610pilonHSYRG00411 [Hibiscus syriacus]
MHLDLLDMAGDFDNDSGVVAVSWRKSSKTVLLHLGHFGFSSESITYIKHLGHPTRTMDVVTVSGLLIVTMSTSQDTHELGGDVGDTVADPLGDDDSILRLSLGGGSFSSTQA